MKKEFACALICLLALLGKGQSGRQRLPLVDEMSYQKKGWYFAPGVTTMIPLERNRTDIRIIKPTGVNDTLYNGAFEAKGRVGLYLEVGRHHFTNKIYFVDHFDYGVHFKMLRGREDFGGMMQVNGAQMHVDNQGKFSQSFLGLFFNASNIQQLGDNFWLHNSLGVNAEYRVMSRVNYDGPTTGMIQSTPKPYLFQLHYKIGFGWKADPGLYFMPCIETPILSLFPFDDGNSNLQFFSTRYRPIIVTLRVMFLDKRKGRECENQPGHPETDVNKDDPGKHQERGLWGEDVKKRKRARRK